jgi:hypothetical protein
MNKRTLVSTLAAAVASFALGSALAQHAPGPAQPQTVTLDAQGHSPEWEQSPQWRELFDLSVKMLGANGSAVDVAAYEQESYAIFRAFAESIGADPNGMLEHLKDIPRQIVAIVADDPAVLDSYENFLVALRGPR